MGEISKTISKFIKNVNGEFRDEETLKLALKKRLTKKEYKLLFSKIYQTSEEEIAKSLKLNPSELSTLWQKIEKKLNRDSIKLELFLYGKQRD